MSGWQTMRSFTPSLIRLSECQTICSFTLLSRRSNERGSFLVDAAASAAKKEKRRSSSEPSTGLNSIFENDIIPLRMLRSHGTGSPSLICVRRHVRRTRVRIIAVLIEEKQNDNDTFCQSSAAADSQRRDVCLGVFSVRAVVLSPRAAVVESFHSSVNGVHAALRREERNVNMEAQVNLVENCSPRRRSKSNQKERDKAITHNCTDTRERGKSREDDSSPSSSITSAHSSSR